MNRIQHLYAWVIDEPDGEALASLPLPMTPPRFFLGVTSRPENFELFRQCAQAKADELRKPLRLIRAKVEGELEHVTPVVPPPATATMPPPNEDDDDL